MIKVFLNAHKRDLDAFGPQMPEMVLNLSWRVREGFVRVQTGLKLVQIFKMSNLLLGLIVSQTC